MLDKDTLKRRIEAARTLRGLSQRELQKLFDADGLNEYDAGKIERGDKAMQRAHRDAFVRLLGVPANWFSEKDVDRLLNPPPDPPGEPTQLDRIELAVAEISALKSDVKDLARTVAQQSRELRALRDRDRRKEPPAGERQ